MVAGSMSSRANRLLHWRDIEHFKAQGLRVFDLGGYAYNTEDEGLKRVNEFNHLKAIAEIKKKKAV